MQECAISSTEWQLGSISANKSLFSAFPNMEAWFFILYVLNEHLKFNLQAVVWNISFIKQLVTTEKRILFSDLSVGWIFNQVYTNYCMNLMIRKILFPTSNYTFKPDSEKANFKGHLEVFSWICEHTLFSPGAEGNFTHRQGIQHFHKSVMVDACCAAFTQMSTDTEHTLCCALTLSVPHERHECRILTVWAEQSITLS